MVILGLLYLWYVRGYFRVVYLSCSSCGWILMVFLFVGGVRIRIRCRLGGCLSCSSSVFCYVYALLALDIWLITG